MVKKKYNPFNKNDDEYTIKLKRKLNSVYIRTIIEFKKVNQDIPIILPSLFVPFYKDNACIPFWNSNIENISKNIFLPSDDNIKPLPKYTKKFNKGKWFKSEFYKECSEHNDDIIFTPSTDDDMINKVVKIKIYPTPIQLATIKRFMGVYRYFYNRTISYCNNIKDNESFYYIDASDKNTKVTVECPKSKYAWFSLKKILYTNFPEWLTNIKFEAHSCKQAIKEALTNVITNIQKYKKTNKQFKMNFKTKKDLRQVLILEKSSFSSEKNTLFANYKPHDGEFSDTKIFEHLRMSDKISKYDYCGSNLTYHRILNELTLNLTHKINKTKCEQTKVCAIDPGVNNFATIYSDNKVIKMGIDCQTKINKVCKEIDIIHSRTDMKEYYVFENGKKVTREMNANRRRNLRKALYRKIEYLKNLKNELHNQTINYLTTHYSKIITSPFKTQEMVCKLSSKIARVMNTLSFYTFRQKLKTKCEERNCCLEIKPEYYTSMCCTRCGNLKYNLGNAKVYECNKCNLTIQRDFNGARNIMLRNNY